MTGTHLCAQSSNPEYVHKICEGSAYVYIYTTYQIARVCQKTFTIDKSSYSFIINPYATKCALTTSRLILSDFQIYSKPSFLALPLPMTVTLKAHWLGMTNAAM